MAPVNAIVIYGATLCWEGEEFLPYLYMTAYHPDGFKGCSWYEIIGKEIYTTVDHPDGFKIWPWYEIRDNEIYTTGNHPDGYKGLPWYEIND